MMGWLIKGLLWIAGLIISVIVTVNITHSSDAFGWDQALTQSIPSLYAMLVLPWATHSAAALFGILLTLAIIRIARSRKAERENREYEEGLRLRSQMISLMSIYHQKASASDSPSDWKVRLIPLVDAMWKKARRFGIATPRDDNLDPDERLVLAIDFIEDYEPLLDSLEYDLARSLSKAKYNPGTQKPAGEPAG